VPLNGDVNPCAKFRGTAPLKFGKTKKNVQNSARFRTAFEFDRNYFWNGLKYRQAVNGFFNYHPFHVKCGKIVGLGFTNHKVVFAHFDLPNIDSSRIFKQL